MNDLFRMFHDKSSSSEIREKFITLLYKSTSFSKTFFNVNRYIKELKLTLKLTFKKIYFKFVFDRDREKSLKYVSNSTRSSYKFSRLLSRFRQS